jgi:hypothetical protein
MHNMFGLLDLETWLTPGCMVNAPRQSALDNQLTPRLTVGGGGGKMSYVYCGKCHT